MHECLDLVGTSAGIDLCPAFNQQAQIHCSNDDLGNPMQVSLDRPSMDGQQFKAKFYKDPPMASILLMAASDRGGALLHHEHQQCRGQWQSSTVVQSG